MRLIRNKLYAEIRPIACSSGHPQRRPFGRHIVFLFGKTVVRFEFSYNSKGLTYLCGECVDGYF